MRDSLPEAVDWSRRLFPGAASEGSRLPATVKDVARTML